MQPHLVRRQAARRLVHGFDRHRHIGFHVGGSDAASEAMGAHRQVGRIELEIEARIDDCLVFVRQRLGGGLEIGRVRLVIEIGEIKEHLPGRYRGDEGHLRRCPAESLFEVGDVAMHRVLVAQLDRSLHIGHDEMAAAFVLDEQFVDDVRKVAEIGRDELRSIGEAGVALHHVVAEADLAHLAVGDDVDARLALLADHLDDGLLHPRGEFVLVDRLFVEQIPHHAGEVRRPRQAAGMGGENAVGAPLHPSLPRPIAPLQRRSGRALRARRGFCPIVRCSLPLGKALDIAAKVRPAGYLMP